MVGAISLHSGFALPKGNVVCVKLYARCLHLAALRVGAREHNRVGYWCVENTVFDDTR
jgi:hypothetical protein